MPPPEQMPMTPSLRELYADIVGAYNEKKRALDAQFVLYRTLYRPLSFPLTVLFIRAGFSANQVSLLNAGLLAVVLALLASGRDTLMVGGAVLFFVFYVLDFVDGNIARYRNQASYLGKLLDGTIDTIAYLIFAAVAIGNARAGHSLIGAQLEIAIGVATLVAALFNQNAVFRIAYLRLESQSVAASGDLAASTAAGRQRGFLKFGNWSYQNVLVSTPVVLMVTILPGYLTAFTLIFAVVHVGLGTAATALGMLQARRSLDRARSH